MRLESISPVSNSDFLITVVGLNRNDNTPVKWTTFSGVKFKRSSAEYNDGLSNIKRYTDGGIISYDPVTISKPYDPEEDTAVYDWIQTNSTGTKFAFSVRPVRRAYEGNNSRYFWGNRVWSFTGCDIVGYSGLEGIDTADGSQTTMVSIEIRYEQVEHKAA